MTATEFTSRLGIFARTFCRSTPAEVADAVAAAGYPLAHWNFVAIGGDALAAGVGDGEFDEVRRAFDERGVGIPSVSATFNTIHPDHDQRRRQTALAVALIGRVPRLGADVVTLCSGTRDPSHLWRHHPDNTDRSAWHDLRRTLDPLLEAAAAAGVRLGIEPEHGNVIRDADTAARLLTELGDGAPIGIVLDAANLLTPATAVDQHRILAHAVDVLGPRVLAAHAKDVVAEGYAAAGAGLLDYPAFLAQLDRLTPVPLIVQDATEHDAPRVRIDLIRRYATMTPDLGR